MLVPYLMCVVLSPVDDNLFADAEDEMAPELRDGGHRTGLSWTQIRARQRNSQWERGAATKKTSTMKHEVRNMKNK